MQLSTTTNSTHETVQALKERLQQVEMANALQRPEDVDSISTGCPRFDRLLPDGGWRRGTLVEWLSAGRGSGAGTLALLAARQVSAEGGAVVVLDNRGDFYPPAAAMLGMNLDNLVVIRAATEKDRLWALDQVLRCEGVAAVWAPQDELDPHTFRRLQLAAESSGALGLLVRDQRVRGLPTWSYLQLLVRPCGEAGSEAGREVRGEGVAEVRGQGAVRRKGSRLLHPPGADLGAGKSGVGGDRQMRVELLRSRQGRSGDWVELQVDEVTGAIREASRTIIEKQGIDETAFFESLSWLVSWDLESNRPKLYMDFADSYIESLWIV